MKNKKIIIILGLLISLIVIPLFKPGYIFSLDQVLNPNGWMSKIGGNTYLLGLFSQIFIFFHIPIWIMEKIIIILTFVLPAIGGYLLTKKTKNNYVILFTSLFLVFNPFLYDRFSDGQINIYLSYSLYPLFFYYLKSTLEKYNFKKAILLALFSLILCLISIHNLMFLFFIFIIFSIFYLKEIGYKNIFKILLSVFIVNLLWLVPFFLLKVEKFELSKQINKFGIEHQKVFETKVEGENIYFKLLSLHGYWGENQRRFSNIKDINKKSDNLFILIFLLIGIGLFSKLNFIKNKSTEGFNPFKKFNNFEKSILLLAIISYILALGNSQNNIFSGITNFLYEYLPFYKGMREPQKWVIFLVIFYAYFGGLGIKFLSEKVKKINIENYVKIILLLFLVGTPVFYNFNMLFGFNNQLSIHKYPQEWAEIKKIIFNENNNFKNIDCEYLKENKSSYCYNSISFPWHSYMGVKFTNKIVGGWILQYFGNNILYGDNMEIGNIYTQSTRIESKIIEKYIGPNGILRNSEKINKNNLENFILDLKGLGIKNIILVKEEDYRFYKKVLEKLEEIKLVEKLKNNSMIVLYRIIT